MAVNLRRRVSRATRLNDAILSLQPTAYWPMDDGAGALRDLTGRWPATVTGSPTYGATGPNPVGRGITWPGGSVYATTATGITQPTTSMSVLAIFSTADATAATRTLAGRQAANQSSWFLGLISSHQIRFTVYQSTGSNHAVAAPSGTWNDGAVHTAVGTFDGTTVRCGMDAAAAASSTSLTGTWHTASTAAIAIAAFATASPFIGTTFRLGYWSDRVLTDTERLFIHSIAKGG